MNLGIELRFRNLFTQEKKQRHTVVHGEIIVSELYIFISMAGDRWHKEEET